MKNEQQHICILRFGPFTHTVTTREFKEIIRYPKPTGTIEVAYKGEKFDVSKIDPKILEFKYSKQLERDVYEYTYHKEV